MNSVRLGTVIRYSNGYNGQTLVIELEDGRVFDISIEVVKERIADGALILTDKRLSSNNKLIERDTYWTILLGRLKEIRSNRYRMELANRVLRTVGRKDSIERIVGTVNMAVDAVTGEIIKQMQYGLKEVTKSSTAKYNSIYDRICNEAIWDAVLK